MNDTALSPQKPKLFQLRAFSGKPKDKRLNFRRRKSETDFLTPDQVKTPFIICYFYLRKAYSSTEISTSMNFEY